MCAYNVRQKRTLDHDPDSGTSHGVAALRRLVIWLVGAGAIYLVYLLATRYVF
jgi:hypothetical protein